MKTRILLFCRPLLRLRAQIDPGKSWPFIYSLILVLIGGYISVVVFGLFAKQGLVNKTKSSKDTVLVSLLNFPKQAVFSAGDTGRSRLYDTTKSKRPVDTSKRTDSQPTMASRPLPPSPPIPEAVQSNAVQRIKLERFGPSFWLIALVIAGCLAGAFYIGYFNLPYLSTEMSRDLDPAALTILFRQNALAIEALGNPRKIKRLSNKMRFQYYYLTSKGITSADSLSALGKALLLLEKAPAEDQTAEEQPSAKLSPDEAYAQFLKANSLDKTTTNFQRIFFALNRDFFT